MFTGIVQAVGRIERLAPFGDGLRLSVFVANLDVSDIAVGDSVAVNGCCLTVVERDGHRLAFDVSAETLRCTAGLDAIGDVNLEKALRLSDRLGGHLVTGHVDGTGTVVDVSPVAPGGDASARVVVRAPPELARFIAQKGSIAMHGVSLTVNEVDDRSFSVNLIPHTLGVTTLARLAPHDRVNLEVDLLARYAERLNQFDR